MPDLLFVPQAEPAHIGALRKAADRACSKYAEISRQNPDDLWKNAMCSEYPDDIEDTHEGREFSNAFDRLRRAERFEILHNLCVQ
jgi:hypothetical protein